MAIALAGGGGVLASPGSYAAQKEGQILAAQTAAGYPVVKSVRLHPNLNIPWSRTVRITDPFEGSFLGVFDRNDISHRDLGYGSGKLVSLWSRDSIRVLLITQQGRCTIAYNTGFLGSYGLFPYRRVTSLFYDYPYYPYGSVCVGINTPREIQKLLIRAGEKVLELEGQNNAFTVNDEIATALKNLPTQNVDIRMVLEGGETVDSEIGKGTVAAWKTIY
ncbi:hypothetical protein [Leptothermofonsia sp. ETS-13]|uniref:hypothetical protein n=1 Tax=Leptothermofonsia sp. ETS-13 TaxID=3035696 RepID=UPI003BA26FC7